jgi:hypothetical protein
VHQHHPWLGTPPLFNPRIQHPLTPPLNLPLRAPLHDIHLPCQTLNPFILPPSRCHHHLSPNNILQYQLHHYLGYCIFLCSDICTFPPSLIFHNNDKETKLNGNSNATPSPPTGTQIVPLAPPPKPLSSSTVSQIPLPIYTSTSSPCAWSGKYSSRNDNVSAYLSYLVLDSCKYFPLPPSPSSSSPQKQL